MLSRQASHHRRAWVLALIIALGFGLFSLAANLGWGELTPVAEWLNNLNQILRWGLTIGVPLVAGAVPVSVDYLSSSLCCRDAGVAAPGGYRALGEEHGLVPTQNNVSQRVFDRYSKINEAILAKKGSSLTRRFPETAQEKFASMAAALVKLVINMCSESHLSSQQRVALAHQYLAWLNQEKQSLSVEALNLTALQGTGFYQYCLLPSDLIRSELLAEKISVASVSRESDEKIDSFDHEYCTPRVNTSNMLPSDTGSTPFFKIAPVRRIEGTCVSFEDAMAGTPEVPVVVPSLFNMPQIQMP